MKKLIVIWLLMLSACVQAQTDTIRYVHPGGSFNNDGLSWATPKNRLQDAINDLHYYLETNNLTHGAVYVAAGTYVPTESTETDGGSMLNTSFKLYGGISVYGGFNPDAPEARPGLRVMSNGKVVEENWSDPSGIGTTSGSEIASQWDLRHKTILTGNHSSTAPTFVFDSIRGRYNTAYPASSYHVVWFATNGKYETGNEETEGHYRPLDHPALLDGCVISSGNASTRATAGHEHTAYGGGAYLVGNAMLRNCTVERCCATLRGGGVYLDGGGIVEFCLIHTCQTVGVGVVQGYGGGACIDYDGQIGHSHITNCAARCGGGMAICHISGEYPLTSTSNYSPFTTACVINNNTASAEGGGIYLAEGGTVNHATVTANNCISPDVTYYGRRHGRSGGIYIRDCGNIFNSVFWGNRCATNNDIQFATVRQVVKSGYEVFVYHSAFMNHDISDWTNVRKDYVFSLEKNNLPTRGSTSNHCCFFHPTVDPQDWDKYDPSEGIYGPGVFLHIRPVDVPGPRVWHLTSYSGLDQKGVQVSDAVQDASEWLRHAHTDYGVVSNPYEPTSTLGALVRKPDPLTYALVAPQGQEGRMGGDPIPTMFIDPNRSGVYDEDGNFVPQSKEGNSWDTPSRDIGQALSVFRKYLVDDPGGNHHYMLPALDGDGMATGEPTRYEYVQILVKEGISKTIGPGNYLDRNIRTAAIRVESHMRLYGGYSSALTGTSTEGRNPRSYKSTITANITGKTGAAAYANYSAHVIAMVNVEHSIVDGFTLSDANTHNVYMSNSAHAGGGLLMNNGNTPQDRRINMVGNQLRNCVINNCSSPKGAAIYVNGEYPLADGEICYAELQLVNCVVRNNQADFSIAGNNVTESHGIITANGRAYVHIEHCTVVSNVGYPFKADSKNTDTDEPIRCPHLEHDYQSIYKGYIRVDNSLIFCNGDRRLDNNGQLGGVSDVLSVNADGQDHVFGLHNMFDADLRLHKTDASQPHGFFQNGYTVPITEHFLPDGISSHYTDDIGGIPTSAEARNNKCIFTRDDASLPTFPTFRNPSRNVGISEDGDKPLYGGSVAYYPMSTNPCVNAAHEDDYTEHDNYDRSDNIMRDRGGAPDIGAVENDDLPSNGEVIYVTPDGAGKRDGSSWSNAIAGNTVYAMYGAGPASGDRLDTDNSTTRLINATTGEPVLTTDERYQGGFARSYFTSGITGVETSTTVTDTWTSEVKVYVGGSLAGERVTLQDRVFTETSETTTDNAGSADPSYSSAWGLDTRYPYGELSGASRTFWRANPYTGSPSDYGSFTTFIAAEQANGWINNTRRENYVSGLQYAVETASQINKTRHKDSVQVWVGAGKYTDYKGFVMRDSVSVYGGFPVGKYSSPGMSERQALMSDVVNIPKSLPAKDFDASDYETILQISDTAPNRNNALNQNAIRFQDNDLSYTQTTDTRSYEYKTKYITHTYTFTVDETDNTATYIYHPNFDNSSNIRDKNTGVPGHKVYGKAPAPAGKDYWHFTYPTSPTYYYLEITPQSGKLRIFNYDTGAKIEDKDSRWFRSSNGSLTGLNMYQTMYDIEAGTHQLTLDMMGGYRSGSPFDITTPSNIWLHILDASGNDLADSVLLKCRDYSSPTGTNATNVRLTAFRKTIEFTTTATQDITIMVKVLDGTKNTKAADATYGTDDGRDPVDIPWYYKWDNGTEANPSQPWGTKNPNRREFFITNLKLITSGAYIHTNTSEVENDTVVDNPKATEVHSADVYEVTTSRSTLRKRVLSMPDVCVPTYGGGGIGNPVVMEKPFGGDSLPHTDRTTGAVKDLRTASLNRKREDPAYIAYSDANWDGFTIRHGFLYNEAMSHGGGAGVAMYEGAHLRNCIVINNISACRNVKGGGIFCDGATSTIEGCFVLNNASVAGSEVMQNQIFAGGMFMYEGTCFNSLFANNYSYGSAGGLGFCVGRFFNNTVAYNTATLVENGKISGGAISLATASNPNLFVANTVVYGNNGVAIRDRNTSFNNVNPFLYCYIQSEVAQPYAATNRNVGNYGTKTGAYDNYGINNIYLNGVAPSEQNSPFAADYVNGVYTPGNARATNDYQLVNIHDTTCVNKGTEDFAGEFLTALMQKMSRSEKYVKNLFVYQTVEAAELPANDVAFAARVQDCQIDIGAYEFNAAYSIRPDTTTHPGKAIFYIAYESPGGDASSGSPKNAACGQKLQQVLDAAGRYKYGLMTAALYNRGYTTVDGKPVPDAFVSKRPNKCWTVEVWLQGDNTNSTTSNEYSASYSPTRSSKHGITNYIDNTLDYTFLVPHGVQVKGGYKEGYYHYVNSATGETVVDNYGYVLTDTTGMAYRIVDDRDILTYRTVLSGKVVSSTGAEGQCYHVVSFTDRLYDADQNIIPTAGEGDDYGVHLDILSALPDAESHRAVMDGVFIEDGMANAPDHEDMRGAGAVVQGYAHILNCVVQNNSANEYGGGLYLMPNALVSGTILKNNSANTGGGIYIESPADPSPENLAHVFFCTICDNSATASAGGMWFDNTYARVNSTVLWHNSANDNANVSGSFTRTSSDTEYPFNFCAVESRRLEGQCNIEVSPRATEGTRWDASDPFSALQYYPIEMSSVLTRAGLTYDEWGKLLVRYPTLDSMDIAGVCRLAWDSVPGATRGFAWGSDKLVTKLNYTIDIGARAINKTFQISVDERHVMRRLFVMRTELLNTDAARALQNNKNTDDISMMYKQMGSCILNPFHRVGDALDYIIAARKADPQHLRNARFEVYVEQGTYYPYHNAYGEQGQVRNNTFLIPEATTIIGGINSRAAGHNYCQAGYIDPYTRTIIGDGSDVTVPGTEYTLDYALADSIRLQDARHRPMRDVNLNSVIEPWELERQTILSGNAVSGEDFTHVYHVITIHADSTVLGPQPLRFHLDWGEANWQHPELDPKYHGALLGDTLDQADEDEFVRECERSVMARAIIIDGIHIVGGYANHLDPGDTVRHHYITKTYFRGGGIFVDGNWRETFDDVSGNDLPNVTEPSKYNIPLVVRNCQFHDNMAGNGGGVYSNGDLHFYACHFTQNYSQGPVTKLDQKFIPWTAGGAIATNSYCGVINTLFDNNEARRGLYPITAISDKENIPHADARQGFGGALSVSQTSLLRACNCHFMRNKAVAYSAIYNFLANSHYTNRDSIQAAFNTMFWGNEVFDVDNIGQLDCVEPPSQESIDVFNETYKASRAGVFHYDGDDWARYEQLFHNYDSTYNYWLVRNDTFNTAVLDTLALLRAQGNKVEGLFYSSYRKTYGPSGMRSNSEGYLLTPEEAHSFTDARALPVPYKIDPASGNVDGDYSHGFTYLRGNNNVLINRVNTAADGPNFRQPSLVAGIDGYMQNADWLSTKKTLTTDQGWGHLKQTVAPGTAHFITSWTGEIMFNTLDEALAAAKAKYEELHPGAAATDNDVREGVMPIAGSPTAEFDDVQAMPGALYNYLSYRSALLLNDYSTPPMPCGEEPYMMHINSSADGTVETPMYRISKDHKLNVRDAYIDMGIYEYQYIQLNLRGNQVDTVWVAPKWKDAMHHDGLSWETPTTDLQAAIDLLMSSNNNHDKYICFMTDEEADTFYPDNPIDNRLTFTITSNSISPLLPDGAVADKDYYVNSITFLGGYNFNVKDAARDPQANPAKIIMQAGIAPENQMNQLFIIEDMTREMIQANWQGELRTRDEHVIPVTFDGITFINPYSTKDPTNDTLPTSGGVMSKKGGAAIYYRWQHQYFEQEGVFTPDFNLALLADSAYVDRRNRELPKLTLSNCIFMDNGKRNVPLEERSPAVRIDHGGGKSLIVNSLFHSNAGAPVYSRTSDVVSGENNLAQVPNDVIIVNSTFALNDGHITLDAAGSEVHNSIIWLDDLASDSLVQLQINTNRWDRTTNNDRAGIADRVTNNAIWGCFRSGDDAYHNTNLVTSNHDIFRGPYFINPDVSASTSEARRARNFRLNPGVKMMNMGDTTIYRNRVFFRQYPDSTVAIDDKWWARPLGFKGADVNSVIQDTELGGKSRVTGAGMERGAYECQAVIQRVLYVNPTLTPAMAGDGSSWANAFGQGQLQSAIDVASVYTHFKNEEGETNPDSRKAYVYVKGSNNTKERVDLIARDGVFVFGSIPGSYNDTAWLDDGEYKNYECRRYMNEVRATLPGIAAPGAASSQTRISSLSAPDDNFNTGFLLEGFVISNPDTVLEQSPVVLNTHIALRNCIFSDNHVEGAPLVDLNRGLIYNSLFLRDTAEALIKAGSASLVLNNTIIASREGDLPIDDTDATAENIINNITHNTASGTAACFASYLTPDNAYTLPEYLSRYAELGYQLHEHSALIDAGTEYASLPSSYNQYKSDRMINFDLDRDLLGNPRRIGSAIDKGALETWRVPAKGVQQLTSLTNIIHTEAQRETAGEAMADGYTTHYGGNEYPHPGSVVYLMDSSVMTMAFDDANDFSGIIFRPGFMLMKPGASFYGNGHDVMMNYLAVEKRLKNQRMTLSAFPFDYYTDNITSTSYNSSTGVLTQHINPVAFNTYVYNGVARSAKDYTFRTENSLLWLPVDTAHRVATEGYLVDYGTPQDTLLRFNSFGTTVGEYVYTENELDKMVTLRQHDNRTAGAGTGLNFTRQEDMGWNMKGLPWLVTNYRTDTILLEGNYLRQMYIPHVFYCMGGDGNYLYANAPDQIYTARSWDQGTAISMGNAFLTQTATMNDHEDIIFHLPFYGINQGATHPIMRVSGRRSGQSDIITVMPDSLASKRIEYHYGRDGVKWLSADTLTSAYILDNTGVSKVSLLGAAPTDTDIPVGIRVPQDDDITFSLPDLEPFADYGYVWLIDYKLHAYTNLLDDDYTVALAAGNYDNRFAIRIGGYPITDINGQRKYTIFVRGEMLHIHGLIRGDLITVVSPNGQLVVHTRATDTSFITSLPVTSGYVVKVNDHAQKVLR